MVFHIDGQHRFGDGPILLLLSPKGSISRSFHPRGPSQGLQLKALAGFHCS